MKTVNQKGAAVLISSIIISTAVLSMILSMMYVGLNNAGSNRSYKQSVQDFFASQSGAEEALLQIKKRPNDLTFSLFNVMSIDVSRQFVDSLGSSDIEAVATSSLATKKVKYSCTQELSDCTWSEIAP